MWQRCCCVAYQPSSDRVWGWVGTQTDMDFFKDLKSEIKDQCEKLGKVESIGVFEDNPDGIIAIQFKEPEAVVACIAVCHSIT